MVKTPKKQKQRTNFNGIDGNVITSLAIFQCQCGIVTMLHGMYCLWHLMTMPLMIMLYKTMMLMVLLALQTNVCVTSSVKSTLWLLWQLPVIIKWTHCFTICLPSSLACWLHMVDCFTDCMVDWLPQQITYDWLIDLQNSIMYV